MGRCLFFIVDFFFCLIYTFSKVFFFIFCCSHACEYEASLILHISPELVKPEKFTDVDILQHHSDFIAGDACYGGQKVVWSTFGIQQPKYGGCGDPTGATAETGRVITQAVRKNCARWLREYYFHKRIMPE